MRFGTDRARAALGKLFRDLRSNRLWPLALVVLVAIVAVPIALSKSTRGTSVAAGPAVAPPPSGTALPALNVRAQPAHSKLRGRGRDPFAQHGAARSTTSASGTSTTSVSGSGTASQGTTGGGAGSSGTSTAATGTSSAPPTSTLTSPPSITPNKQPIPAPSGLTAHESYRVSVAVTNPSGGVDTIDPLERLTVLPSAQRPLLVELGVLQGGKRVLFAVQRGTVVGGPGGCTPGPVDCEILSLGQNQTESLSAGRSQVVLFAVTGITVDRHASAPAALAARRAESAAGRALLNGSTVAALSLFRYEPSLGSVVDLRDLTVGDG